MATTSTLAPPLGSGTSVASHTALTHQVSWGAILAGAVAGLVAQIVINLVGLGVGLSMLDAGGGTNPAAGTFSLGAGLWWVGSGVVASLIGGYLAGRLSGRPSSSTGGYHGLVSWAVTTLVVLYLLTSTVGGLIGGAFGTVASAIGGAGQAIGGTAQTVAQAAPSLTKVSNPFDGIERQVRQSTGGQDPAALRDAAIGSLRAALSGDAAQQKQAEDRAVEALAKAQNISVDDARTQVQGYKKQYEQAVADATQKAKAAAEIARSATAQGALYAALALLIGALAAYLGGHMGTVRSGNIRT